MIRVCFTGSRRDPASDPRHRKSKVKYVHFSAVVEMPAVPRHGECVLAPWQGLEGRVPFRVEQVTWVPGGEDHDVVVVLRSLEADPNLSVKDPAAWRAAH